MPEEKRWDVFFSYASPDRVEVEKLALRLEDEAHLKVFLDKWRLVPGERFIPGLQEAIRASLSCALFLGKQGIRPWQNVEMEAALVRAVNRANQAGESAFRIVPVLLPGAKELTEEEIPDFVGLQTWVDFRSTKGLDDSDAFNRLVAGIRGVAPGRPLASPSWLTTLPGTELERPTGIAVDDESIFVADHATGQLQRIDKGMVVKRHAGLHKPHHVIVMDDAVIVADTHNHQLVFFDRDLTVRDKRTGFGEYVLRRPHGLASNYPNEFYLTDADNHRVLLIQNGEVTAVVGRPGGRSGFEPAEFSIPCGVAASPDCIYVADTYNHRIQVFARDFRFLSTFGSIGHGLGEFAYPVAVAAWQQWIVVADEHNKRLQLWRRNGQGVPFTATCISVDLCNGWLGSPFGLCFDEDGRLLVADRKEGRVLRIDFNRMLSDLRGPTGASGGQY